MASAPQENAFLMQSLGDLDSQDQGCGCFKSFGLFTSHKKYVANDVDQVHLLPERQDEGESWIMTQLKRLREASELVAGPKWKNFIRKIGAYFNNNNKRKGFHYDSFNYTLNFDDGIHDDDQDGVNLGFSSRFAPPVVLNDKARSST